MSDSLLNLLEILDEVLEEQELQEQASGGDPTEQELWDIVSPGLDTFIYRYYQDIIDEKKKPYLDEIGQNEEQNEKFENLTPEEKDEIITKQMTHNERNKLKRIFQFRTALLEEITNKKKNFSVAFGVLNKQIKEEENIDPKLKKITFWLSNLNAFYASSETKEAVIDSTILQAMLRGVGVPKAPNPKKLEEVGNSRLTIEIVKNMSLFPSRRAGADKVSLAMESRERRLLVLFLNNLKNGEPSFGFYKGTKKTNSLPSGLAEDYKLLDLRDFEKLKIVGKKGDLSTTEDFLARTSKLANERLRIAYIEEIQESYDEIFQFFLENPNQLIKHAKSIKSCLSAFISKVSDGKSDKRGEIKFPEHTNFINKWMNKFSTEYQSILKKADTDGDLGRSISSPSIKTSRGSLSEDFGDTLDVFFGNATGFAERLNIFNKKMSIFALSKEEFQNSLKDQEKVKDVLDFMNRIFMMDYFVEFSKGFSAPTAGLMFEYFLAGLVGGKVVGQRGNAVDFKVGNSLGSAKFISVEKYATQAISSFQEAGVLNNKVNYVIGMKKPSEIVFADEATAPLEIQEVDIYNFTITYKGNLIFQVNNGKDEDLKNKKRKNKNIFYNKGNNAVEFTNIIKQGTPVATIKIMSTDQNGIKTYRQTLDAMLETEDKETLKLERDVLNKVKEIFDNIKGGESAARSYAQTGDLEKGQSAMEQLSNSREAITDLSTFSEKYKLKAAANDT